MRIRVSPRVAVLMGGAVLALAWSALAGRGGKEALDVEEVLTVAVAALLHELGHAAAAWGWGVPIRSLKLDLFGARMELGGLIGYTAELAVAAGGPLVSLLCFALAWPLGGYGEGSYLFAVSSLGLGMLNLFPVRGLDGGRMLACILSLLFGDRVAETVLRITTGLALGGLWLLSVYALLRAGETLSLVAFSLCLLIRLWGSEN